MNTEIFSIRDNQLANFHQPFILPNETIAKRTITMTMDVENNHLSRFPEMFSLMKIGTFNPETGIITGFQPEHIANLADLKTKEVKNENL